MQKSITKRAVDAVKPGQIIADDELPGFVGQAPHNKARQLIVGDDLAGLDRINRALRNRLLHVHRWNRGSVRAPLMHRCGSKRNLIRETWRNPKNTEKSPL